MVKILILDDEPRFSGSLKGLLEGLGHEVAVAASVTEVLEEQVSEPPDLLICDLVLPGPEPLAAVASLRAVSPELSVIAVSGFFEEGTSTQKFVEQSAAIGFLHKPFDFDVLVEMMRKCLGTATEESRGTQEPDLPEGGSLAETSLATVLLRASASFGAVVTVEANRSKSRFFLSRERLCYWQSDRPGMNLPGLLGLTEKQCRPAIKRGRVLGRSLIKSLTSAGLTTESMAMNAWKSGVERVLPPLLVAPGNCQVVESSAWLDLVPDLDLDLVDLVMRGLKDCDAESMRSYLGDRLHGLMLPGERGDDLGTMHRRVFPGGLRSRLSRSGVLLDDLLRPLWSDPRRREEAVAEIYALLVSQQAIVLPRAVEPEVGTAGGMGVVVEREHVHDNLTGLEPEVRELREGIRELAISLGDLNHYEILGVDPTAEKTAIQDGFRELFSRYHADRTRGLDLGSDMELVARIQAAAGLARESLLDPEKRQEYDTQLARQASGASSDVEAILATDGKVRRVERLLSESRFKQARRIIDELLDVNRAEPRFQVLDNFCGAMMGENGAEDVYEDLKDRFKDLAMVGSHRMLGELALRLSREDAAKRHFREAIQANGNDHVAARNYRRLGGKI